MSESIEQQIVIRWRDHHAQDYPDLALLHSIPNGGYRAGRWGIQMVKEGVVRGIPDLFLPVAKHGMHGFYIEMKYGKGKTSKEQDSVMARLVENGYYAQVCYGAGMAIMLIYDYLEMECKCGFCREWVVSGVGK